MTQPQWDLVIFDCDGVLVDSEAIAQQVLSDVLALLGVAMTPAAVGERFFGKTVPKCIEIIEDLIGRELDSDFIAQWRDRLYRAFREAPVRAVDGVADALHKIRVPTCVVSNGPMEKMHTTLGVTGLLPLFQGRLFSPDLGLPGKPRPDLFLAAARAVHAVPARCVVIEDSPGGIAGAHAAGMQALGFTGLAHIDAAALAATGARTFAHMDELVPLLRQRAAEIRQAERS